MKISLKNVAGTAVVVLLGLAISRAATFRFQETRDAFVRQAAAELKKLGITRDEAKKKYPTPEIHLVSIAGCIPAGGTGEVVVKGKFSPGTKFIVENDNFEVVKENLTPVEYRARVKAAAGIGPQSAALTVISPVTAITARHDRAVASGGKFEWLLDATNGWKVVGRPRGTKACDAKSGGDEYELHFFRKGESAPFEQRIATLNFSLYNRENYGFSIGGEAGAQNEVEGMTALMQKMADPKLTDAQRDQLLKRIEKAQQEMMAKVSRMTDPANIKRIQQQEQEFGCNSLYMEVQGGSVKGRLNCSQKLGRVEVAGTMRPM